MKTLDEVIDALEICGHDESPKCPYFDTEHWCCCEDYMRSISPLKDDALHYLRLFQKHEERVRGQLDDLKEEYRPNDPLTWDELRQMEGKPVWVEGSLLLSHWLIIDEVKDDYIICADRYRLSIPLYKDVMGKIWQAYRKERS